MALNRGGGGGGVLKKKIWDLSLLQSKPEASEKVWRIERREFSSCAIGVPIKSVSSTNWLCNIGGEMPCKGRPVIKLIAPAT
jgi:hypothetical protein